MNQSTGQITLYQSADGSVATEVKLEAGSVCAKFVHCKIELFGISG